MEDSKCVACHGILPENGEVVSEGLCEGGIHFLKRRS